MATKETMIGRLADLTRRLGCLHEFQVTNLKRWPLVMVNALQSEFRYDHVSRSVLIFVDKVDPVPENMDERVKFLGESVQMLLGTDIQVEIEIKEPEIKMSICPPMYSPPKNVTST